MPSPDLIQRAQQYLALKGPTVEFIGQLGFGEDGAVWETNVRSAVKAFERQRNYEQELACYLRLDECNCERLGEFSIPRLIDACDDLLVIEIEIVHRPFLLDFGKAYLDAPPLYFHDAAFMAQFHQQYAELWDDRWPEVQSLLWQLEKMGIYYFDPKPGNILFDDD